jgi:DNA polymerase-3 subunit gamma/tau
LRKAWTTFAELRKNQVAEYHLLTEEYLVKDTLVTILLTNPIEEPLLQSLKPDLVGYLREKLTNSQIQIEGILQQVDVKKKAYTNKEKFEYLKEKNPMIKKFQEKFGLDPEF